MWAPLFRSNYPKQWLNGVMMIIVALSFASKGFAQLNDTSTLVLLNDKGQPLVGAYVHSSDFGWQLLTNENGIAKVTDWPEVDSLCFTSFGYDVVTMAVEDLQLSEIVEVILSPISHHLDEVVVVGRTDANQRSLPYQVDQIKARDLAFTQSQTSADALANHAAVFVQKSQMGGGSPILRGFEANRVLLVVDGVRMNNAIYRSGHLQNAITVDPTSLSQMEVIYGPGSLLYGSDALGGVIHFRTQEPPMSTGESLEKDIDAFVRFASANQEKTAHASFGVGGRKFGYRGTFTFSDFEDLQSGSKADDRFPDFGKRLYFVRVTDSEDQHIKNADPYLQKGTSYWQFDMMHKLKWRPSFTFEQTFNFQYSTSSDIPRYDQLIEEDDGPADLTFAEWYYGPQDRLLLSSRTKWLSKNPAFDKALLILAIQEIGENRINRRVGQLRRTHQEESIRVYSATLDLEKNLSKDERWQLGYGLAYDYNDLTSVAFSTDREGGDIRFDELTRYPDDLAVMGSLGIYGQLTAQWSDRLTSNFGVRYSHITTEIAYTPQLVRWPDQYYQGIQNLNDAFTWSASLNYLLSEGMHILGSIGSAFRAPNVDDLAKIRIKGGSASTPNPDLRPEQSLQTELTLTKELPSKNGQHLFSITGFYTHLDHAIIQAVSTLPNGDSILEYAGEQFHVVANVNANEGRVWGVSLSSEIQLAADLTFEGSINFIKGRTETSENEEPMAHIPPLYGRGTLRYEKGSWRLEGIIRFNGAKDISQYSSNSADNLDKATPVGTPAWTTYNLYASYEINKTLRAQVALENLFDLHYRPFASGLSAPGRNIALSLYAMM